MEGVIIRSIFVLIKQPDMKKIILFALLALSFASCKFFERKYTIEQRVELNGEIIIDQQIITASEGTYYSGEPIIINGSAWTVK